MVSFRDAKFVILGALFSATSGRYVAGPKGVVNEAQNKEYSSDDFGREEREPENYFQEIYMLQSAPKQLEFGHVFENPREWEQRYEKKDFDHNRHQGKHAPESAKYDFGYRRGNDDHFGERYEKTGPVNGQFKTKVRWADKRGSHGEHYWDYNHTGYSGDTEEEGGESKQFTTEAAVPVRQHKRQLQPQPEEKPVEREKPLSDGVEEFLKSFRREVGSVFDLELLNRNIFTEKKDVPFKLDDNFRYLYNLPRVEIPESYAAS